ncbi:hypothetical protein RC55_23435 [Herbaspirillum seropedicae]|nr:hypothetical protein ACP92_07880 [Herbaspirillum seropedicae]NQE32158.1 hypothetical protein [Herbaspirillum seropedicae]
MRFIEMFSLPFGLSRPLGAVSKALMPLMPRQPRLRYAAALLLSPNGSRGAIQKKPFRKPHPENRKLMYPQCFQ